MKETVTPNKIRLSVIDDHPVIFWGIQAAIKKLKISTIEFGNQYLSGKEVIDDLDNLNSDVLLIDLCLPDMKGYELSRKILEVHPTMKIGIYTNVLLKNDILNSYQNGALGYLLKSAEAEELIDFLHTINRGERYIRGIIADIIFENEDLFGKQKNVNITKRESEILELILEGHKNREIAGKLSIAERTVEFHKQNIYLKLEVNNSIDLFKKAIRKNFVWTKTKSIDKRGG